MILVDVQVLQLGEVYDFEVDEEKKAEEVLLDMVALICRKEKTRVNPEEKLYLYAVERECILCGELSLKAQGVRGGERLVLV